LVQHLGNDQPFYGLQPPGLDGQSQPLRPVEDLAEYFAAQIKAFQPNDPYTIAGYCAGGAIAFELARQLLRDGGKVSVLILFGAPYASAYRLRSRFRLRLVGEAARVARHLRALAALSGVERRSYILEKYLSCSSLLLVFSSSFLGGEQPIDQEQPLISLGTRDQKTKIRTLQSNKRFWPDG
jgi:thioesterase domain-containing protein